MEEILAAEDTKPVIQSKAVSENQTDPLMVDPFGDNADFTDPPMVTLILLPGAEVLYMFCIALDENIA